MNKIQNIIQKNLNQLVAINTIDNVDDLNIVLIGFILDYDENYILLESIDERGVLKIYDLFKISFINKIENNSLYLNLMQKYIKIQKQYNRYNMYNLNKPDEIFYKEGDKISIKKCLNNLFINKELICICFNGYVGNNEDCMAYITDLKDNYVSLKEVDTLDINYKNNLKVCIDEINSLSIQNANINLASLSFSL